MFRSSRIALLHSSLPGLTRQSIFFLVFLALKDGSPGQAQVKPGDDAEVMSRKPYQPNERSKAKRLR
jgi:hypothetical protein